MERRIAVVTVSYNTWELTAFLLWSLRRVLHGVIEAVVVVDNGSTDGSAELLRVADTAGLCTLIANTTNRGHGPALDQALHLVSERTSAEWAWLLDSDCVVARADTLTHVEHRVGVTVPALIGEANWDQWLERDRFELYSMILDLPQVMALGQLPLFTDGGDPSFALIRRAEAANLQLLQFPFAREGFVIHRGRGTLAQVFAHNEREHPLYEWSKSHHEPHYGGVSGAEAAYMVLRHRFLDEVDGDPARITQLPPLK